MFELRQIQCWDTSDMGELLFGIALLSDPGFALPPQTNPHKAYTEQQTCICALTRSTAKRAEQMKCENENVPATRKRDCVASKATWGR